MIHILTGPNGFDLDALGSTFRRVLEFPDRILLGSQHHGRLNSSTSEFPSLLSRSGFQRCEDPIVEPIYRIILRAHGGAFVFAELSSSSVSSDCCRVRSEGRPAVSARCSVNGAGIENALVDRRGLMSVIEPSATSGEAIWRSLSMSVGSVNCAARTRGADPRRSEVSGFVTLARILQATD
jgi:hypothetical protein